MQRNIDTCHQTNFPSPHATAINYIITIDGSTFLAVVPGNRGNSSILIDTACNLGAFNYFRTILSCSLGQCLTNICGITLTIKG